MTAFLIDLDGTLIDTAPDIALALDAALSAHALPPAGLMATREWIGGGASALVQRALCQLAPRECDRLQRPVLDRFFTEYRGTNGRSSAVYPQVQSTLDRLQRSGARLACVTNKPEEFTSVLLQRTGLANALSAVVCGDTLPVRKPDPAPLQRALDLLDASAQDAWMIGDSETDVLAGRAAGTRVGWVTFGYHRGMGADQLAPDRVLQRFDELLNIAGLAPQ